MAARALRSTEHPLLAHLIPVRRCNLSCTYCNEFDDFSKPVPTEEMLRRIDKLGALGTAVLGSIVTAVYRSSLRLPGVPAPLARQAQQSFAIAIHAGGPVGTHARTAFVDGIHAGLLYAAGAAILAAIAVATLLSSHPLPAPPQTVTPRPVRTS